MENLKQAETLAETIAPKKDEACVASAGQVGSHQQEHRESAISETDRKAFETYQARAALAGFSVDDLGTAGGPARYVAGRWGLTRELQSLQAVELFLRQVGAPE